MYFFYMKISDLQYYRNEQKKISGFWFYNLIIVFYYSIKNYKILLKLHKNIIDV